MMIKDTGSGSDSSTFPTKLFVLFCGYFLFSLGMAWWLPYPIVWGFCGVTFILLCFLVLRSDWFLHHHKAKGSSVHDSMESWLKENQPVFESLFEHNPNIVFLLDRQACIIKVNGNTEQIMGYLNTEMENQQFQLLLTPETAIHSLLAFLNACDGIPQTFKTAVLHKDGYRIDLDVTAAPIKQGLKVTGIIVIGQDITSTKRTEERIRHMA